MAIWGAIDNPARVAAYVARAGFDRVETRQVPARDRLGGPLWAVTGRQP